MDEDRSTINSTIKGKAYEYACLTALVEMVQLIRPVEIVENSSLLIARNRYLNDISEEERSDMLASAKAGIGTIIKMEPKIIEDGQDKLTVSLQSDDVAKLGDIRDVLIIRRDIKWEIGVSVKHNHEALKHSRLSTKLDFGKSWFGIPSSSVYFEEISLIFAELQNLKGRKVKWRELPDKEQSVYVPILNAFMGELQRAYEKYGDDVTSGLVKYLLGSNGNDYYKLIHYKNHTARVIPFNLFGTLNQSSNSTDPDSVIPDMDLPTRIIELSFKDGSRTTVHLTMNNGWAISFRIHNASTIVEPSLKFDIKLLGQPSSLFFIDVAW
jgi:type-2 restriction enzyme haeIII